LENLKTENICKKMKSLDFRIQNYLCVSQQRAPTVPRCGHAEKWISKAKCSRSNGLSFARKIQNLFDTAEAVSAIGMCALGCTVAKPNKFCLFVVTGDILFKKSWFEIFCHVLVRSGGCRCLLLLVA
jgi:hypothetical protein